jgi:hypothetical protein
VAEGTENVRDQQCVVSLVNRIVTNLFKIICAFSEVLQVSDIHPFSNFISFKIDFNIILPQGFPVVSLIYVFLPKHSLLNIISGMRNMYTKQVERKVRNLTLEYDSTTH